MDVLLVRATLALRSAAGAKQPKVLDVSSWTESGATCLACGIGISSQGFASAADQRQHFKTDWHRCNVKRRLAKKLPLSEEDFDRVIEQDEDVGCCRGCCCKGNLLIRHKTWTPLDC